MTATRDRTDVAVATPSRGANAADCLAGMGGVVITRGTGPDRFRLCIDTLRVLPGEPVAVIGPSGAGKSTLLEVLALVLRPDAGGRFLFRPEGHAPHDVLAAWRAGGRGLDQLRARHIGYVPQTGGLLPFLSARDNIALPARINGRTNERRLADLAARLKIGDQLAKWPHQLSAGQRQRVAIARALIHHPALVLADEPTGNLDPDSAREVLDLLLEEADHAGVAVLIATHDHAAVARRGLARIRLHVSRGAAGMVARAVPEAA